MDYQGISLSVWSAIEKVSIVFNNLLIPKEISYNARTNKDQKGGQLVVKESKDDCFQIVSK